MATWHAMGGGRRGLHAEIVHRLGSMIASGRLGVDEPLVSEDIGKQYGVSRTVVRESLRVLEAKGLVSARPNVGTRVRPIAEWNLLDPDVIDWRVHGPGYREQLRELLELRAAMEPYAARLAAGRADPRARKLLRGAAAEMERAAGRQDVAGFTEADIDFHHTLLRASGNHMIEQLHVTVAAALHVRGEQLLTDDDISAEAVAMHRELAEAVAGGEEDLAEQRTRALLDESGHAIDLVLASWRRREQA